MAVLLIGVGYIGSQIAVALLERGEEVVAIDNFFSTDSKAVRRLSKNPGFHLIRGDVADPRTLDKVFSAGVALTVVYHLAAQSSAHPDAATPDYTERTNLRAPRLLLDAMLAHGVSTLVFGSALKVCGDALLPLVTESTPYGVFHDLSHLSKCYVEKLMEMYADIHGVRCIAVRLGICYGVSPVMKQDPKFMTVVNKFCRQAVCGQPLAVSRSGLLPQGFIHVEDAAAALIQAAEARDLQGFAPVNAASEVESVLEVAQMVGAAAARRGIAVEVVTEASAVETKARPQVSSRFEFQFRHNLEYGIRELLVYWEKVAGRCAWS